MLAGLLPWDLMMWSVVPFLLLSAFVAAFLMPPRTDNLRRPFDLWGSLSLSAFILGTLFFINQVRPQGASVMVGIAGMRVLTTAGLSVLGCIAFIISQRKVANPIIPKAILTFETNINLAYWFGKQFASQGLFPVLVTYVFTYHPNVKVIRLDCRPGRQPS